MTLQIKCKIMALGLFGVLMPFLIIGQNGLFSFTEKQMGTSFTLLIYEEENIAKECAIKAFREVERINKIFSNYNDSSEVSMVNYNYSWQFVSHELAQLIIFSEKLRKQSNGAFDIRIGKAIDYWKEAIENNEFPNRSEISSFQEQKLKIRVKKSKNGYKIKMNRNTKLDFGAIAKGYAVDKAYDLLIENGLKIFLIDGGGDIRLADSPPDKQGWNILISADGENEFRKIKNISLATSGSQFQHLLYKEKKYSHIIDPRSKIGSTYNKNVSIIANSCMVADALSTTLSISDDFVTLGKFYDFRCIIKKDGAYIKKDF